MATVPAVTRYTPEDLLAMPDEGRYELIDGQLVERKMGAKSSYAAARLLHLVANFNDKRALGLPFQADCGYQVFKRDRDRVRYADGSFIRAGRLPGDEPPLGHCRVSPDLVIESVSPHDTAAEVEQKVDEWLAADVRLVWVLYPDNQHIHVHRPDGTVTRLRSNDELTGEAVLPGFKCRVGQVFAVLRPKPRRARKK